MVRRNFGGVKENVGLHALVGYGITKFICYFRVLSLLDRGRGGEFGSRRAV